MSHKILIVLFTGYTHKETRGKEAPRTERGGGETGHRSGGGPLPGPETEGGHREGQNPAVLPDGSSQELPRKAYTQR